ncbi:uncharacterized protein V1516DRAFT_673376, partial [Lipomyces oligophaga]|uniref:uncharacterized protein n=1 Tax=Lipomyces oligophaga TaxID=45792 RepID=UPI0034CF9BA7
MQVKLSCIFNYILGSNPYLVYPLRNFLTLGRTSGYCFVFESTESAGKFKDVLQNVMLYGQKIGFNIRASAVLSKHKSTYQSVLISKLPQYTTPEIMAEFVRGFQLLATEQESIKQIVPHLHSERYLIHLASAEEAYRLVQKVHQTHWNPDSPSYHLEAEL